MTSTTMTNTVSRHIEATIANGVLSTAYTSLGEFSGNLIPSVMAVSCDVAGGLSTLALHVLRKDATALDGSDVSTPIATFAVSAGVADFQIPASVLTQLKEFIVAADRVQEGTQVQLALKGNADTTAEVTVSAVLGFIDRV